NGRSEPADLASIPAASVVVHGRSLTGRAERPVASVVLPPPARARRRHAHDMNDQLAPRYPGLPSIVDGSEAIAHVETRISEVACVYPITPPPPMGRIF